MLPHVLPDTATAAEAMGPQAREACATLEVSSDKPQTQQFHIKHDRDSQHPTLQGVAGARA